MSRAPALDAISTASSVGITIADLFSQQAARTPDAVAVIADEGTLTYRELEQRCTRLAARLLSLGVVPDTLVGVATERSQMLIVGLLAILKAGAAYVPLDLSYPKDRLAWIVEDSAMQVLLTTGGVRGKLSFESGGIRILDAGTTDDKDDGTAGASSAAKGSNLAYVIYTSGSTGRPKGVMVENRNVVNFFSAMDEVIGSEPGVWLAVTSVAFDISVLELLWTLCRGFTVVLHRMEGPGLIADELVRHQVTHLQMTPSLARMLALDARGFASLVTVKKLLLGGEAVPVSLIQHLRRTYTGEIFNMYGPTETTIWSTTCRIKDVDNTVPIGQPILNTQVYLLDAQLNPVPQGSIGELFIGGDGVARGYWNRPDLTAERFLVLPSVSQQRLYRTGDMARIMPDGNIEFLGRSDYQIKLRGHRIELGEIETALEQCRGVRQAVVVPREDRPGDMRLTAYLVAAYSTELKAEDLRSYLAPRLPDFMIPAHFVFLAALPLTDNGKIDRKALLQLPPPGPAVGSTTAPPEHEPESEMERLLARIWQESIGISSVGLNENFFDLGAHSLTVAEVHARLQGALGREIPMVDLFQFTTVKMLAAHLEGTGPSSRLAERAQRRRLARQ